MKFRTRCIHSVGVFVRACLNFPMNHVIHVTKRAQRSNDSDEDLEAAPTKRPRLDHGSHSVSRKFGGASTYKSKFQKSWQKKWACVTPAKNDCNAFYCTVCSKVVSCAHKERGMLHVILPQLNTNVILELYKILQQWIAIHLLTHKKRPSKEYYYETR